MKRKTFIRNGIMAGATVFTLPNFAKSTKKEDKSNTLSPKIVRNGEGGNVNVLGDNMTFKLTGKDTDGQLMLLEEDNPPGVMIPPHVHTKEDEIFKVVEGELEITVGGKTTILKAGDLAFAPKNVPHSWKVVGDKNCKTILTAFPAGIEVMFEELGGLPKGEPDFAKVSEICGRYGISFIK